MQPDSRPNTFAAGVVDDGLQITLSSGRRAAAHFLRMHGVRFPVIVRVLASAAHRREPVNRRTAC